MASGLRKDIFRKEVLSISINRGGVGGEREQNLRRLEEGRGEMGARLPLREDDSKRGLPMAVAWMASY